MAPTDPNEIDINLSLLPGESEAAINSLVANMRAISAQLAVLSAGDTGVAARAQLVAFQQTGMPTHGVSATASRAGADLGNIPAIRNAEQAKDRADAASRMADEAEEARKRQLQEAKERRDSAEEARSQAQADRDAQRLAQEHQRDQERQRQQEELDRRARQEYAAGRAQESLDAAGLRRGLRYIRTGQIDLNQGLPRSEAGIPEVTPFTPEEQETALARVQPQGGRVARFANRVLQVWHPDRQGIGDEAVRAQAQARAHQSVAADAASRGESVQVGGASTGASRPPGVGDAGSNAANTGDINDLPAWMTHISREQAGAGIVNPSTFGGEFTAQNTLQIMAQMLGRGAYAQRNTGGTGNALGSTAAVFQRMANAAPMMAHAQQTMARRGFDLSGDNLERVAYLTGAATPGTIGVPGTGIRVINPLDVGVARAKGLYGLGQMAMEAGAQGSYLRTGQAAQLAGEMVNRGFGRETTINALRGPLSHLRGSTRAQMDPATLVDEWQKATMAGGESMDRFVQSMDSVVPAARAARMNVDEMNASLAEHAEAVQSLGGTYVGGRIAGANFATTTGLPPQVLTQLMNDPLNQGLIFGQTGMMPQLQGMLPSSMQAQQGIGSLRMLTNMYSAGLDDRHINIPGGGHMTISAERQAQALAGQAMGLDSQEAVDRLLSRQTVVDQMAPVNMAYEGYQQDIEQARARYGQNTPEFRQAVSRINRGRGESGVSRQQIADAMDKAGLDGASILDKQDAKTAADIFGVGQDIIQELRDWGG
jgi:hypothetical protein